MFQGERVLIAMSLVLLKMSASESTHTHETEAGV